MNAHIGWQLFDEPIDQLASALVAGGAVYALVSGIAVSRAIGAFRPGTAAPALLTCLGAMLIGVSATWLIVALASMLLWICYGMASRNLALIVPNARNQLNPLLTVGVQLANALMDAVRAASVTE